MPLVSRYSNITLLRTAVVLTALLHPLLCYGGPIQFCRDPQCQDCIDGPSVGLGYPSCARYNTDDLCSDQSFNGSAAAGYDIYFNVADPGDLNHLILAIPDPNDDYKYLPGDCASWMVKADWTLARCSKQTIKNGDFMLRTCHGDDECKQAGVGQMSVTSSTSKPTATANSVPSNPKTPPGRYMRRSDPKNSHACDKWTADPGMEKYKRSGETQIVSEYITPGSSGGSISITHTREQSWTTTIGADFGFADVLSLSLSVSSSQESSISDSTAYNFNLGANDAGKVGFTPTLICTSGSGHCKLQGMSEPDWVNGEICFPMPDGAGGLAGASELITSG